MTMATTNSSSIKGKPNGFANLLSLAACEWFLMFLLFVDAALSYLLTKFAQCYELEIPCLLCSRFEFGFGRKKPGFYWSLLCRNHKLEITSFVSCGKFTDAKEMFEDNLPPIALHNKSDPESCRLVAGKAWVSVDPSVVQNLMLNKNTQLGFSDSGMACSCCNKSSKAKPNAGKFVDHNPVVNAVCNTNMRPPLPRPPGRSRRRESLKRLTKSLGSKKYGSNNGDSLSRVRSNKRILPLAHSDSEILVSEDEEANVRACETHSEPDRDIQSDKHDLHEAVTLNATLEKQAHQGCEVKLLNLRHHNEYELGMNKTAGSLSSDASVESGSRDLNWEDTCIRHPPYLCESSPIEASIETAKSYNSLPQMLVISEVAELVPFRKIPALNTAITKINVGVASEKGAILEHRHTKAISPTRLYDTRAVDLNNKCLLDASTQALSDEIEMLSDEQACKQPHVSSSELNLLARDASPTGPLRTSNDPWGGGLAPTDIEGESVADRLKRQVDLYKDYMDSLYKELEEERNASAIATDEAMAMITKLQEEKASIHMEAMQCLRMMEEQAAYDSEVLARANDLLAERETELQDLEYELEFYKEKFSDELAIMQETSLVDNQLKADSISTFDASSNSIDAAKIPDEGDNSKLMNDLVSNFEESISYISQCLKKLEENLHQDNYNGNSDNMPDVLISDKTELEDSAHESLSIQDTDKLLNQDREDVHSSNGNLARKETEISELRERLEAFEKDCNFLKCTLELLWNKKME